MNRTKALLLAAGLGTRLRPLTASIPKCLVPVAGRPLLDYWIDLLEEAGVDETRLNTHSFANLVRAYIERVNDRGGLTLIERFESKLLGSAGTIAANADFADDADELIIIYADNLSDVDLRALLEFHRQHDDPMTMMLFHAPNPRACGIAELDAAARIVSFTEKPQCPTSDLANAGVYVMDASAYREIAARRAFDLAFDILPQVVGRMRGWVSEGYHLDIGTPEDYEQCQHDVQTLSMRRNGNTRKRIAAFLDRDGTIIDHVHYLSDPADVRIRPGAAEAIRALLAADVACVVVTNQSAVGRGMITEDDLDSIHCEMNRQLAQADVELDGIYYCPVVPQLTEACLVEHLDRKPGPGLLWQAARDLSIDVSRSWMVGDNLSDLLAGRNAGCRGSILIDEDSAQRDAGVNWTRTFHTAVDLPAAATQILNHCHNRL